MATTTQTKTATKTAGDLELTPPEPVPVVAPIGRPGWCP